MADYTNVVINGSTYTASGTSDTYTSTTVTNGGQFNINDWVSAYNTDVNTNGIIKQEGGYISGVSADGTGRVSALWNGTLAENIHIDTGTNAIGTPRLDIRTGARVNGATVSGAFVQVTGQNAQISGATLDKNAQMYVYNYASAQDINDIGGNDVRVYSNGKIVNVTALKGYLQVYNTAECSNATIGGSLWMGSNGHASQVQILSKGSAMLASSGAFIENVHIDSGGSNAIAYPNLDLRAGRALNVVASGAAVQVLARNGAASISGVILEENATMGVYENASAQDVTVNSGLFWIRGGASATNVTVYDRMQVSSAGLLTNVQLYGTNTGGATSKAYIVVASNGKLVGGVVSGGRLDVQAGASAENVVVSGGYGLVVRGATVTNCSAVGATGNNYIFIQQGAKLDGGYFADHGRLRLEANCSAWNLVFENSVANSNFIIDPGAWTSDYILRGADTVVEMRGTALDGVVSGGTLNFTSGGTLTRLTVANGGNFNFGATGDITNVNMLAGGKLAGKFSWDHDFTIATIADGTATVADNVTVTTARMDVKADGVASGATIEGGNAVVSAGGSFTNGTLLGNNTGGATNANYVVVSNGGKISDTVVSGARVDVSAGASAENIAVTYGYGLVVRGATATNVSAVGTAGKNYLFIQSASIANGAYIANNGEFRLDGNCSATDVVFDNGGATIIGNGAYTSKLTIRGANANIGYAGTVLDATVSGGKLNFSSGTLTGLTVSAGSANISSGGVANNVTVLGGIAYAYVGGSIDGATVASGAEICASKGTIENVTVEKGGALYVRDGGFVSGATISGYAEMYTGTLSSAYVQGGELRVYNPGYAENIWVDTAPLIVRYEGAVVSKAYVSGGKITSIQNKGIARELTQSGGRLRIDVNGSYAGTVSGATLTNVWTEIFDTGELSGFVAAGNSTVVNTGAKLLDGTALDGNKIDVMGGYASKITVSSGAQIWVSSGGMITDLTLNGAYAEVNAGGNISGATVNKAVANGDLRVYNGYATDVNVSGAGVQIVLRYSTASGSDITASAGAYLQIQNGATARDLTVSGARLIFGMAPSTTGNTGSAWGAKLTDARVDMASGGLLSGFNAKGGSMFIASGAKIEDGTAKGGEITISAGAQMVDVAADDGATVTITGEYKAAATIVGSKTAFGEGALTYGEVALDGAAKNGVISGLNGHGSEFRLGIGDGITVKDAYLDNGNTRISAFNSANVDGAHVTAGAVICNAGASGTMANVTLEGAGIMNLSGTATADNTVIKAGGKLSLNTANVKIDNTTIYAGGIFSNVNNADTGAAFTFAFENAAATMNVDLTKLAGSTTLFATGVEAVGSYALGSGGTVTGVTQKWGLYENAITSGGSYADALNGLTYAFDGTTISATELTVSTGAAAGLTSDNTYAGGGTNRAAKWTGATAAATLVTENFSGDAYLTVAGDAAAAIYGAGVDFAGTVNIDAKSGTIRNLAAGAEAGKTVGAVKLTFEGATLNGVGYAGGFGNVTSKTETLIEDGTFTMDFYAGALANYKTTNTATTVGDISLTINDGTFSGNIYGASGVKSGGATSLVHGAGAVTLTITGGETTKGNQACIFAGGYATGTSNSANAVYMVNDVTVTISGGDWGTAAGGRGLFGGVFASGVTAQGNNVSITVDGGTIGNVYGGGWAQKGGNSVVENVTIVITGTAEVANVFGGGAHSSAAPASTTGVDLVEITVSGGNITGAIYAKGQSDGDSVADAYVTFTGTNDYTCDVFGYSYVSEDPTGVSNLLTFNNYTGTFAGAIGGFAEIKLDANTEMTMTADADDVKNTAWNFDLAGRSTTLAGTAVLDWSAASFAGETPSTLTVNFTDEAQAKGGWSIAELATDTDFTGATFTLQIGGSDVTGATGLVYGQIISETGTAYDGWGFQLEDTTLKFKQLA